MGTILRHEAISIFIPRPARIPDMLAMVCSSGRSLPAMKVLVSDAGSSISKAWALASRFSTSSMTKSGPVCTTFFTVQRSMERRMPWRSFSEISAGKSTWILKICL
ncbi:hypothetical protein D3C84_1140630 [compost metagenome]